MPLYEYACRKCERDFEVLVTATGEEVRCPDCDGVELDRLFGVPARGRVIDGQTTNCRGDGPPVWSSRSTIDAGGGSTTGGACGSAPSGNIGISAGFLAIIGVRLAMRVCEKAGGVCEIGPMNFVIAPRMASRSGGETDSIDVTTPSISSVVLNAPRRTRVS